ncbi:hypothetical protein HHX47_DHR1001067, partial [Lentinula edodes]
EDVSCQSAEKGDQYNLRIMIEPASVDCDYPSDLTANHHPIQSLFGAFQTWIDRRLNGTSSQVETQHDGSPASGPQG